MTDDPTAALIAFIRGRLDEREQRAQRQRRVRDFYREPCPRCGRPADGFGSAIDEGAAARITHQGDPLGCALTAEEWAAFGDGGPTPEATAQLRETEVDRSLLQEYQNLLSAQQENARETAEQGEHDTLRGEADYIAAGLRVLERWAWRKAAIWADHPDYQPAADTTIPES
ncbi:DUF6221 family protein [Streptomyces aidingensis]|uniref:Uncharacterized protein n=1 Tax=Streptomyces aidingensis TaxID=910347 RepID=A0A1I1PWF2_9ACTN|nr:DUF6221 family protein [Streptomyces aidingensis]SFD14105.1 hypothetical protein SAMN05421773_11095 [Streptomyces aidingensis]